MQVAYFPLQQTLKDALSIQGIGIHTGTTVQLIVRPAAPDTGYVIRRVDLPGCPEIPVNVSSVTQTMYATTLRDGDAQVATVEHVLSALAGLGVDNAVLEVDSFEVPVMDGSALPLAREIERVGLVFQQATRSVLAVTKTITVGTSDRWIRVEPHPWLVVDFTLIYDHPVIGTTNLVYAHTPAKYIEDIAAARTFTIEGELEKMRGLGLAQGGSLDNAVVATRDGVVNPGGLRYPDEFVRHKILDVLGDFSLLGGLVAGKITAYRSGHETNRQAVEALLEQNAVSKRIVQESVDEGEILALLSEENGGQAE